MSINGRSTPKQTEPLVKAVEEAREAVRDADQPGISAKRWASRMDSEINFTGGTYVVQLCGVRGTATMGPEFALRSWLEKAEKKLVDRDRRAA